jgi:hypothetical protein
MRASIRAKERALRNWQEVVDNVNANGGLIFGYDVKLGKGPPSMSQLRYTTVSEQDFKDLITRLVAFDDPDAEPQEKREELKRQIDHAMKRARWQSQQLHRDLTKVMLPEGKRILALSREQLAALEKQLAALPPADAPLASEPGGGLKPITETTGTTARYRLEGEDKTGRFSIFFKLLDDGRLSIGFGKARAVTRPAGSTSFSFKTKSGRLEGTNVYDVQMTAGLLADGTLVVHGTFTHAKPNSSVPERRKPRTAVFWNRKGPKPGGWDTKEGATNDD